MSQTAREWVMTHTGLRPSWRVVLFILAEHANAQGLCWPSQERIAALCGLSVRHLRRVLVGLVGAGLLVITHRQGDGSGRYSDLYQLQLDTPGSGERPEDNLSGCPEGKGTFPAGQTDIGGEASGHFGQGKRTGVSAKSKEESQNSTLSPPLSPRSPGVDGPSCPVALPAWLSPTLWVEFLKHRRQLKAPLSEFAQQRALQELTRLQGLGQDPEAVLTQSIVNGWKGLFPVKCGTQTQAGPRDFSARRVDTTIGNLKSVFGGNDEEHNLPRDDVVSRGGLRSGDPHGAGAGLLGPARRAGR